MTERDFQRSVVALIKEKGLRYYAVSNSRVVASCRGWPDLFVVGPGGALARELKVNPRKKRPEQDEWIAALNQAGIDAGMWWPWDLASGLIERELDTLV